jgi:hypothetical protein
MALTGEQTVLTGQLGSNGTDALDYLGYWKTFDMAAAAAFAGRDAAALRRDPKFIDMGTWSDGWPVRRLSAEIPRSRAGGGKARARAAPAPLGRGGSPLRTPFFTKPGHPVRRPPQVR